MKMLIKQRELVVGVKEEGDEQNVETMFEYFIGLLKTLGYQEESIKNVMADLVETYEDNINDTIK